MSAERANAMGDGTEEVAANGGFVRGLDMTCTASSKAGVLCKVLLQSCLRTWMMVPT